ncbi:MAG: T9SS type A sorting domain-containing protein [Bacteroidetes bacterium]|nr:T9SS type A sorting domain-containing protein [Bacteroidota bacterium]
MKNRFLPLRLITAFLGLSLLLFSVLTVTGQPGNPDFRKTDGSWVESIRANQNTGMVNPQDVMNARRQADALRVKSTSGAMGLNWLSAGPDNYPGMVWSAIFDNTDTSGLTLVAGSANGGVWKSVNIGLTWTQMTVENNLVLNVSSLVQTSTGTIYAATGVTTCKTVKLNGSGIYRSVNGGAFTAVTGTQGNADFYGVAKLAVAPQSNRLFAATKGGLYFSDNGNDWTRVKAGYAMDVCVGTDGTVISAVGDSAYMSIGGNLDSWVTLTTGKENSLPNSGIGWMVFAIAPSNTNVMYASLAAADGKLLNIYCSIDKGTTWSIVFPNNPTFEPFGTDIGCYANTLGVFPNDPDKIFLGGTNMWYGKRVDPTGFFNWEKISFGDYGSLSPYFSPSYHHSYIFRPNNANQVLMATDGGVSIATIGTNGVTYQTSNKQMQSSQFTTVAYSAQRGYVMGGGDRIGTLALGFFCPSQVSFPNDGYQVWREDETKYGANYQPQHSNYGGNGGTCEWSSVDSRVAVYTKAGTLKVRRQDFTDINYDNDFFLKGVNTVLSAHMPMRLWETFDQGKVFGITRDSVKYFAEQKAVPADTTIMVRSGSNSLLFPYYTTAPIPKGDSIIVADPYASRFFIYGDTLAVKGIYMTKDLLKFNKVTEYYLIFKDLVTDDLVTALAVSKDLSTVWAGTSKGRLIRIANVINAYDSATANIASSQCVLTNTLFTTTPFTGRTVSSISINPNNSAMVMVTLGNYGNQNYVYYTQNAHDATPVFTSIQSNLPQAPIYSGLIEMTGNNNALVGSDLGVFTTTNLNDATPLWAADIQNIGNVPVTDLRQQVIFDYHVLNTGVIYASSYGRGLWMETTYAVVGMDPGPGSVRTSGSLNVNPNPVKDNLNISYTNEKSGNLSLLVYDLTGRLLLNTSYGNQPKGVFNTTINLSSLAHGTYIVKIGTGYGKIVKL